MERSKSIKRAFAALFGVMLLVSTLLFLCDNVKAAPGDEGGTITQEGEMKKPTLNAAVSDKALTVQAQSEAGIKAIYINGYEFKNTGNGNLKIKLTQFDAGYNRFYIYAEDNLGNRSDLYEVENPYYDEDKSDDKDPAKELPVDAAATEATEAVGSVEEHLLSGGREFYTITTETGKTFYLIVDMLSDEEKVYFLTEISENDLLNATSDRSDTLPRNSAIPEDGITDGGIIFNNNASDETIEAVFGKKEGSSEALSETTSEKKTGKESKKDDKDNETKTEEGEKKMGGVSMKALIYVAMGVVCVAIIVIVSSSKKKKKKDKDESNEITEEIREEDEEE